MERNDVTKSKNKVLHDTIPYELVHNKIIIPVQSTALKQKYIVDTGGKKPERCS